MKVSTARRILNKEGVYWTNYFDLNFIEHNTENWQGKENIYDAIQRIKLFFTTGR